MIRNITFFDWFSLVHILTAVIMGFIMCKLKIRERGKWFCCSIEGYRYPDGKNRVSTRRFAACAEDGASGSGDRGKRLESGEDGR